MSAKTKIQNFRIYTRDITKGGDDAVNNLALDVGDALNNHPFFNKLPVSLAVLGQQQAVFSDAMTEARKGGKDRTREKRGQAGALGFAFQNRALLLGRGAA